ncbi:MAG: hypothetical protein KGY68_01485 [Candidatus Thermoplasmatota archaeon]|nr:hypothetical protein [Candidatus Thermoplasmatota archaeon]
MARCMFIDDWNCPVQRDEFPLEICKICVKARSVHNEFTKVKVPENGGERPEEEVKEDFMDISNMIEEVEAGESEQAREELNKKFHEGKLSVEEYIEKRKELPKVSK